MNQPEENLPCIRVLLVAEQTAWRALLRSTIEAAAELSVVAEAGTLAEAVPLVVALAPQVAVANLHLPDGRGGAVCRQLRVPRPELAVLLLSEREWPLLLAEAWAAGATGFLLKASAVDGLVPAVRRAAGGGRVFTPEQQAAIGEWERGVGEQLAVLTPREWAVLELIKDAMSNREIADRLGVSSNTVAKQVGALLGKLQVRSRGGLIVFYNEHHLGERSLGPEGPAPAVSAHPTMTIAIWSMLTIRVWSGLTISLWQELPRRNW